MGQLGLGTVENMRQRKKPMPIESLNSCGIVAIASGSLHNAVIDSYGRVWTWGCNDDYALGRGDVPDGEDYNPALATFIDANGKKLEFSHSLAPVISGPTTQAPTISLESEDGDNKDQPTRIVRVSCGSSHTVALDSRGRVFMCGTYRDAQGVLGLVGFFIRPLILSPQLLSNCVIATVFC